MQRGLVNTEYTCSQAASPCAVVVVSASANRAAPIHDTTTTTIDANRPARILGIRILLLILVWFEYRSGMRECQSVFLAAPKGPFFLLYLPRGDALRACHWL